MAKPVALPPGAMQRYEAARRALEAGSATQAQAVLQDLIQIAPRFAPAHQLLGHALERLGDAAGAERAWRQAVALDKREAGSHALLADFLARQGRQDDAERAYRAALALDRRFAPAVQGLAHLLLEACRPAEAAQATMPLAAGPHPPVPILTLHIQALVAAGRPEDALPFSRKAAAAGAPQAELGTAQLLADLGRFEEAQAMFRAVLAREPGDERARRGLARAAFAGPEGMDGALAVLDEGLARQWSPSLAVFKASLLNQAARSAEAFALLQDAVARQPGDPGLHAAAATAAALSLQPEAAHAHAEHAARLAPDNDDITVLLAETGLGSGRADQALGLLQALRRKAPLDQKRIALTVVAQRLLGDERYRAVYDYDRFVRAYTLEPPRGWASLDAFLADLAARLGEIHDGQGATLDQSVRHGTQTNVNLIKSRDPLIRALFSALDGPVSDYIAALGRSDDPLAEPLRARNQGGFAYGGAWSVRLNPDGGRHVNHIHAQGWLSSAFYVRLPDVMRSDTGREGWIQFGEPNLPTPEPLPAEHWVRPQPGRLVLFPSYMWHGTLPFGGEERRTTFAFDVVPK